jgi:hypothetical protein
MFDPDANRHRINREMAYLTSGIARLLNSRRPVVTDLNPMSALGLVHQP